MKSSQIIIEISLAMRPQPGNEKEKNPYGIWMVERTEKGWSKPGFMGLGY